MDEKIENIQRNDTLSLSREERAIIRAPFEKAQKRGMLSGCTLIPMTGDFGLSRTSIVSSAHNFRVCVLHVSKSH